MGILTTKEEKRELLQKQWEEQIAECESSNMSVKEWCAEKGMNLNTFYGRVSALKRELKCYTERAVDKHPKIW